MDETIQFVVRHGYLLLFFWLLAEQGAIPIPSVPLLLVSGALARTGQLKLSSVFIYALAGCLVADNVWFQLGRRYTAKALQFICKMSLEPDSCVRRTENVFLKYGMRSLLLSKFVPGLNAVAAPLAGGSGANFARFLVFDSLGAFLWLGSYVFVGYIFSDQLEIAVRYAGRMGSGLVIFTMCIFTAWILWKLLQRRRFLKSVDLERISPDELDEMLSAGSDVTIVDVRSKISPDLHSIPAVLRIPVEELPSRNEEIPRDREIILFCT